MERRQELLVPLDVGVQPLVASPVQGRAQHRHDVGRHRNAAVAAGQAERRLAGIVAGQQQELIAQPAAQARHPRDVARGVLETDDARQLGEPPDRHVVQRAGGARGHVVEDDGKADRVVDGAEMHHHAGLGRLEIRRRDAEQRGGAGAFRRARQLDRRGRVVAAGAGDHRHAPGGRRDRPRHDAMMLVRRQQRRLAGRAARHQGGYAAIDQAVAEGLQGVEVDLAQGIGVGRAALAPRQRSMNLLMVFLLGGQCRARPRGQHQPARDVIERHDLEAGRHGVVAHGGQAAAPAAGRALQHDPSVGAGAPARRAQGIVELVLAVDIDDPGEVGRLAIRRGRAGTQAAHAVAAAAQQPENKRQGVVSDDRDVRRGGRWAIAITRSTSAALDASSDTALDGGSTSAASAFSWYMIGPSKIRTKT